MKKNFIFIIALFFIGCETSSTPNSIDTTINFNANALIGTWRDANEKAEEATIKRTYTKDNLVKTKAIFDDFIEESIAYYVAQNLGNDIYLVVTCATSFQQNCSLALHEVKGSKTRFPRFAKGSSIGKSKATAALQPCSFLSEKDAVIECVQYALSSHSDVTAFTKTLLPSGALPSDEYNTLTLVKE